MSDVQTHSDESTEGFNEVLQTMRAKILHVLTVFPAISATMIQTGIGTSTSPKLWRPILDQLIREGEVVEAQISSITPHERHQVYTVYHLKDLDYNSIRATLVKPEPQTQSPEPDAAPAT